MFSLAAPFLGVGFNLVMMLLAGRNRWVVFISALITVALIVLGVVFGIVALMEDRRHSVDGVLPRAVGGICISGFLLLLMAGGVPGLLRAIQQDRERGGETVGQPGTAR
jgi:hypothetical protein